MLVYITFIVSTNLSNLFNDTINISLTYMFLIFVSILNQYLET